MPRRNHNPRRWRTKVVFVDPPEPSTEELARRLVRRGLASVAILSPSRIPHTTISKEF